jgi:hypothetical protein
MAVAGEQSGPTNEQDRSTHARILRDVCELVYGKMFDPMPDFVLE